MNAIKVLAIFFNGYMILMGFAMLARFPENAIGISLVCDLINAIVYYVLMKYKYNHYTYKETQIGDRALIRMMAISAILFPCALMSRPAYFGVSIVVISLFLPTNTQMENMLKCDKWSLIRKVKEESEAKEISENV